MRSRVCDAEVLQLIDELRTSGRKVTGTLVRKELLQRHGVPGGVARIYRLLQSQRDSGGRTIVRQSNGPHELRKEGVAAAAAFSKRAERLRSRILASDKPIVWIRGMAGTGKTTLLRRLADGPERTTRRTLDEPSPADLASAISAAREKGSDKAAPLIVASRPAGVVAEMLMTDQVYGRVDVIHDDSLFLSEEECRGAGLPGLYSATGGWPVLADASTSEREEIRALLPAFLQREVLPTLPEGLVTALFATAAEPLRPEAIDAVLGTEPHLHPLLESSSGRLTVSATWVSDALRRVLAAPAGLPPKLIEPLAHLHTTYGDPPRAVKALIAIGRTEEALALFERAGGLFFGYRHGFPALESVLESFGAEIESRSEGLLLARSHLLFKSGRTAEALRRLEAHFPRLPVDLRRLQTLQSPYAILARIDIAAALEESLPVEVVTSWGQLDAFLPAGDHLAHGILYNTMAMGFLRSEALSQARQLAEEALAAYHRAGSPYLTHFMLEHLADIALWQGRLRDVAGYVQRAEEALTQSGLSFTSDVAFLHVLKARLAYEQGRLEDCPTNFSPILDTLVSGDSTPALIRTLTAFAPLAQLWREGLRVALDTAGQCVLTLGRRHGLSEEREFVLMRARLYQVARRHAQAAVCLTELELMPAPRRSPYWAAEEGLIQLRNQIARHMPPDVSLRATKIIAELPPLEIRQRISLEVLRAFLHHRLGDPGLAKRHLLVALRWAQAEGLVSVLLEDGEFLERLLPSFIAEPRTGNEDIAVFSKHIAASLRALSTSGLRAKALAGVSPQEHRVLVYLSDGCSNKEIARALALSESAVRFHLSNLFRKLKVTRRGALLQRARARGLLR